MADRIRRTKIINIVRQNPGDLGPKFALTKFDRTISGFHFQRQVNGKCNYIFLDVTQSCSDIVVLSIKLRNVIRLLSVKMEYIIIRYHYVEMFVRNHT